MLTMIMSGVLLVGILLGLMLMIPLDLDDDDDDFSGRT